MKPAERPGILELHFRIAGLDSIFFVGMIAHFQSIIVIIDRGIRWIVIGRGIADLPWTKGYCEALL